MARSYTKKSSYWNEPRKPIATQVDMQVATRAPLVHTEVPYATDDKPHFSALAACGGGDNSSATYRNGAAPTLRETTRYKNIREGIMPFDVGRNGYYSVSDAIDLCTRAYYNISILRNAINMLQDFSISPLHIKSANKTVKQFFTNWFDAIGLNDLMSQFFLEYYRSGNVFLYTFNGKIAEDQFNKLKTAISAKSPVLPIRYTILNPMQIYLQIGVLPGSYNYSKMLSTFELARLKNPKTPEDKQVFNSFPKYIQDQIKNGVGLQYVYVPLDTNRLYYAFYRKQPYEPLAIPMAFPILNDIEYKLELKRMDMALARTVEHVILLVTTGEKADEHNPGLNPKNLIALQNIFKNQTIGRVLVADYTTKAEWMIPDLKELLGKAKYEQVDADIKEGLQYMFFGSEKFASASIKAKVFIESLKEGRRVFLNNFLIPEVKKVCEAMNFKNVPVLEFEDIKIEDESARERLYFQMAQIGLLTPDELNKALMTGILPDSLQSMEDQKEFLSAREEGLYFPMVGGTPLLDKQGQPITPAGGGPPPTAGKPGGSKPSGGGGRPSGSGKPLPNKKIGPIGTKRGQFSQKAIIEGVTKMNMLEEDVSSALIKKFKVKGELTEGQKQVATIMTKAIVINEPEGKWSESIASYLKAPKDIAPEVGSALDNLAIEFEVDDWTALVLWKSQINDHE